MKIKPSLSKCVFHQWTHSKSDYSINATKYASWIKKQGSVTLPDPAISADIRIAFTTSSKTRALAASALALCTVASSEAIFTALGTPEKLNEYWMSSKPHPLENNLVSPINI